MATSGFNIFPNISNSGEGSFNFSWERTDIDLIANTSTISWRVTLNTNSNYKCSTTQTSCKVSFYNGEGTFQGSRAGEVNPSTVYGGSVIVISGNQTIKHSLNGDGAFKFFFETGSLSFTSTAGKTTSGAIKWESQRNELDSLDRRAKIVVAADFHDTENIEFDYSNPAKTSAALQFFLSFGDENSGFAHRTLGNDNAYGIATISLTEAERKTLWQETYNTNSKSIRIYIKTILGGATYYDYAVRTVMIFSAPPILAPAVKDTNPITLALTGDENTLVKHQSKASFTTGATAQKEALISSQYIVCAGSRIENQASGTIDEVMSGTFDFSATDSRGYTTKATIEKNTIPYIKLTGTLRIIELDVFGNLTFSISGSYYEGSFGAQSNNLEIKYTLKKNGQPVETDIFINPREEGSFSYDSGIYTYRHTLTGLATEEYDGLTNGYTIQATVKDKLMEVTTDEVTSTATPIFEWDKHSFTFSVPVHFGRGFTNDTGLKTAAAIRTIDITNAGSFPCWNLAELGITTDNNIYNITGAIAYQNKIYPIPSPALSNGVGAYSIGDSTKLWIEGEQIYLSAGAAWGAVSVRIVIMYF